MRLRLIGGFELDIDGRSVEMQPAVQRLTALVALTARGLSRDFAAFQLWPDKAEARAKANLRSTLWRLRQLNATVVCVTPTRVRLGDDVWLDVRDETDPAGRDLVVPRPFDTLMADLLPDWYDDWLLVERERFRQCRLAAFDARAATALAEGDTASALQFALSALSIDATRESSHRIVLDAHRADGNRTEIERAQARFERCLA